MKIYNGLASLKNVTFRSAVTLGVFDGVHLGHRSIISSLVEKSRQLKLKSVAVTFEPHPEKLWNKRQLHYINTLPERLELIESLGVNVCVVVNFTKKFASMEAKKFITEILIKKLRMSAVTVNPEYKFGKDAAGTVHLLDKMGAEYDFKILRVKTVKRGGKTVKSTLIRHLLREACLRRANTLLGRPYFIEAAVIRGSGYGTKLGYPTVNLKLRQDILLPEGVYICQAGLSGEQYEAAVNIGYRPTINKNPYRDRTIEAYLLNFSKNIYGKNIKIHFYKKIRDEKRFKSAAYLKIAIEADVKKTRSYFKIKRLKNLISEV